MDDRERRQRPGPPGFARRYPGSREPTSRRAPSDAAAVFPTSRIPCVWDSEAADSGAPRRHEAVRRRAASATHAVSSQVGFSHWRMPLYSLK